MNINSTIQNVTVDNFEFKGLCWTGSNTPAYMQSTGTNSMISNHYFHGWTHTPFNCGGGGTCDGARAIASDSHGNGDVGNQYVGIVIDGADSDVHSFGFLAFGSYDVHFCVIRNNAQGIVTNNGFTIHDNLIEYIYESNDSVSHSNTFEQNGSQTDLFFYNNLIRHNVPAVNLWFSVGGNAYIFNNVMYDIAPGTNYIAFAGAGGTMFLFNNTLEWTGNIFIGNQNNANVPWNVENNQFITDNGSTLSVIFGSTSSVTSNNNVFQTHAAAANQGYVAGNNYSPSGSTGASVGAGANLTSSCGTLSALCSDTTWGVGYNAANHTVVIPGRNPVPRSSTGAWDAGAYQGGSGGSQRPNPPTSLSVTVK